MPQFRIEPQLNEFSAVLCPGETVYSTTQWHALPTKGYGARFERLLAMLSWMRVVPLQSSDGFLIAQGRTELCTVVYPNLIPVGLPPEAVDAVLRARSTGLVVLVKVVF